MLHGQGLELPVILSQMCVLSVELVKRGAGLSSRQPRSQLLPLPGMGSGPSAHSSHQKLLLLPPELGCGKVSRTVVGLAPGAGRVCDYP